MCVFVRISVCECVLVKAATEGMIRVGKEKGGGGGRNPGTQTVGTYAKKGKG